MMESTDVIGFVSYARTDNDAYDGIVDRLKSEIEGKFYARTGRKLRLFIDRESIGWGEDWRDKINQSVKEAVVFIPVVSQAFFNSDPCRDELLAFTSSAEELGVTDLILPIVIASAERITSDHEQDEVRLIERLNFKDIEDAYVAGYGSSAWRGKIQEMVKSLEARLEIAEARLQELELKDALVVPGEASTQLAEAAETDLGEDYDVYTFSDDLDELTRLAEKTTDAMTSFTESVTNSGIDLNEGTPNQKRANLVRLAAIIKLPAAELGEAAFALERKAIQFDPQLRTMLSSLGRIENTMVQEQRASLLEKLNSINTLTGILVQMGEVAGTLEMVGVVSVNMRKALAPALSGFRSLRNALEIFSTWKELD